MLRDPSVKYRPFPQIDLPDRQWPSRTITQAPRWLSTDMRDGNQALIDPMDAEKKARFFDLLVRIGLKEIEVGFPSAGRDRVRFHLRRWCATDRIPDDVMVQVLTQSRRDLIETSFASLAGAQTAIVHLYNAVSPAWRRIVFGMERAEIKQIAVDGAKVLRDQAAKYPETDWRFEYSPETFSTAELDFSVEVCAAVMDVLQPTRGQADHPQPARDGRGGDAQHLCRPDRMVRAQHSQSRSRRHQPAHAQRPRHGRRSDRIGAAGGRRPRRRLFARQWRADRQCRPRHRRDEYVFAGDRNRASISRTSTRSSTPSNIARASRHIRAAPMPATWYSPPFRAVTRMRSRRALPRRPRAMTRFGTCHICRSIRRIWGEAMRR